MDKEELPDNVIEFRAPGSVATKPKVSGTSDLGERLQRISQNWKRMGELMRELCEAGKSDD